MDMTDFWAQFEAYVRSYLPDWQYQRGGTEPEAALMTVLGELLEDSRTRIAKLPEKHHVEFLNAWDDGARPRDPTHTYVMLAAPNSTLVPKGTVYYQSGDGTKRWEMVQDTWAEPGQLTVQFFAGGACGKLIRAAAATREAPTKLFDFRTPGVQRREVRFLHPSAFASPSGCETVLELEGAPEELLQFLCDPERTDWTLKTREASLPLKAPARSGTRLCFHLPAAEDAWAILACAADGQVPPEQGVRRVSVQTVRPAAKPGMVMTDSGLCQDAVWRPFGERLMQWSTCHISCPEALCLPGAQVTLTWTQTYLQREEILPGMDQEPEYKPVMRRLPQPPPAIRDVSAENVLWEYWDGSVWRVIPGTEQYAQVFSAPDTLDSGGRHMEAAFRWPADARRCEVQGVSAYWLRWRLRTCEGAGWIPARYHAPEVSQLRLSAALSGDEAAVECRHGLERVFTPLTGSAKRVLFPALSGPKDCWWLGFDLPPGGDPLNLYLILRGRVPGGRLSAWEAVPQGGEQPLSLQDQTDGLSHSGMISLYGIRGKKTVRFGMDCWWLCLREETGAFSSGEHVPVLLGLHSGAALLRAVSGETCLPGETFSPLQGGAVSGIALTDGFGGNPEETDREALHRLRTQRHHLNRAVSALDADQLICTTILDVVRTRCVKEGTVLKVGVLMRDAAHHAAVFTLKKGEILQLLMKNSALPAMGLDVEVREPCFYPIHVMVWIQTPPDASFAESKRNLKIALNAFLDPAQGNFNGLGWRMGELPTAAQLRTCLQSAVPGVTLVELVTSVTTPEGAEREVSSIQDPFALPVGGAYSIFNLEGGRRRQ